MERDKVAGLYRRFGPLIYRRCLRLLGDTEKARDATQEVFVRTIRHIATLTEERESLPWLYRVATNYCLNKLRDSRRLEFREPEKMPESPQYTDSENWASARQLILSLFEQLDEQTKKIVIYSYMDGMTQDEIAELMGLSRRTIGKKLNLFSKIVTNWMGQGKTP